MNPENFLDQPDAAALDRQLHEAAAAAAEGDLRAFEQLLSQHHRRILANCRYLTRDPIHAEDLAQEVFVKAYFGLRTFQGQSSVRHWLQRIKVNHCLNYIRKQRGKTFLSMDDDPSLADIPVPPAAEQIIHLTAEQQRIADILNSMPATLRIPLIMCDMDDHSYDEIAAALGIGLSAVKMRIKRGREYFRSRYEQQEPQPQQQRAAGA
ncbi:MAG: RNA polymerase sigma factor [Bryobacterales bacterium]|nr:RNA polymerase sigma factor [Bryobacterales bacterium]